MTTARGASSVSSAWLCGRHAFLCCVARGACAVSCPWNCVCGACGPFSCGVFEQTWSPHHRVRGLPAPQGPSLCHSCSYAYLHEKPRHSLSRVQLHEPLHCTAAHVVHSAVRAIFAVESPRHRCHSRVCKCSQCYNYPFYCQSAQASGARSPEGLDSAECSASTL